MKSGFVALIGRPNAGKSTLLNALLQTKLAIVSDKPQTTRNAIRGIFNDEESQIIFIDTPGIHKPIHTLGSQMNKQAYAQMSGVDIVYYIVDATSPYGSGDEFVLNLIQEIGCKVFLVLNKIDGLTKEEITNVLLQWSKRGNFTEIIPISALTQDNLQELLLTTKQHLEDGVMYYPKDQKSDYPEQFIISEIIREKIIYLTHDEVPHSIAVVIEKMGRKKGVLWMSCLILVDRDSLKGIIIGHGGNMIKKIGQLSRQELEGIFGEKIFLELFVRVEKDWRNKKAKLQQLGYITLEVDDE